MQRSATTDSSTASAWPLAPSCRTPGCIQTTGALITIAAATPSGAKAGEAPEDFHDVDRFGEVRQRCAHLLAMQSYAGVTPAIVGFTGSTR